MRLRFLATAFAGLALAATSARGALVQTKVSSATELAYSAEVSNSDLLTGKTATTTGWNLGNGSTTAELNDGIHGGTNTPVQGTWTTVGATAIYNLGLGANNQGYNLTSIQTIAAWNSAGFGNQGYTVDVKLIGAAGYTTLTMVDYQPFTSAQAGATKVTLTDTTGVLASGVEFIRFTANRVNGTSNAGAFVFRELDVFGTSTAPDSAQPQISALAPSNNASAVLVGTNLVATFNENIARGSGNITIKNLSDSTQTVIPLGDPQVSVAGPVLAINPTGNLAVLKNYAIRIDPGAITDVSGNPFPGIASDTTWNFTTASPDLTAPAIVTLSPVDNATNTPTATNLVLTFSESIALGTGNITIKNLSDSTQTVIAVGNAQVSVSGAVLTINPTGDLAALKNYAIRIDSGAITDLSGNPFPGIADDTTWNFTTASTPLRIMCLGDSITAGYTDNPTWNHPFKFGYRSGLYAHLTNAGYNFKFVGGSTEPWTGISGDPTLGGTYTPALDLRDFAQDGHRGYGGKNISFINGAVAGYIAADTPDVILLLIGINGIGSGSPAALNTLVNTIVTAAPNAHLIVAQITPLASFNQNLYNYNLYIRDTLVPSYAGNGYKVTTVNLYSLFLTNPSEYSSAIAPGVLSNGINHPDNAHYDLMAQEWFNGIGALGLGPVDHFVISTIASPQMVGTPVTGITITAQDASNNTASGFTGTVSFGGTAGCTGTTGNFVAGVLSGVSVTPTVAGSNLTLTVNDGASHSGSANITTVRTQYQAWSGSAVFAGDSNNDGVDNGLAWVLGAANPSVNARGLLPVPTRESGKLVLTFRCMKTVNRGAAVLKVQYSNDLGQADPWTSHEAVVPDVDSTVGSVYFDTAEDADPAFINVRAEIPASAASPAGRLFGCLYSTEN